ncbi:MAG: XdhC family protein [Thermoleophilia bacterium]
MSAVYEEVVGILEAGGRVALATLMARRGSAPGSLGAKMLVREDGTTAGSIGGGCVEAEVWDASRAALASGESRVLAYHLNTEEMAASGLICGGNVEILVEPLGPPHLPVIRGIVESRRVKTPALVVTTVPPGAVVPPEQAARQGAAVPAGEAVRSRKAAFKVLLTADGAMVGPGREAAPEEALRAAWTRLPPAATRVMAREDVEGDVEEGARLLLESVAAPASLLVFGGGHLSEEIVPLAKRVHFQVTVVDDRPMFANPGRFPEADEVLVSEFDEAFERLTLDDNTFVVIVTRGHLHDRLCLERSLATDAAYIGMVGSRAKIKKTYDALAEAGVPRERLQQVHSPIGLDIRARLPEEIAVSIVAELIQVRNSRLFG